MNRYLYLIDVLPFRQLRFPFYAYSEALSQLVRDNRVMIHTFSDELKSWESASEEVIRAREMARTHNKMVVFNFGKSR